MTMKNDNGLTKTNLCSSLRYKMLLQNNPTATLVVLIYCKIKHDKALI